MPARLPHLLLVLVVVVLWLRASPTASFVGGVHPHRTRRGTSTALAATTTETPSAVKVVRALWSAVLAGDVDKAMSFIDPSVVYEDTTFPEALKFDEVRQLFIQCREKLPDDYGFVIDQTTSDEGLSCGITFHAELAGTPITGARGCCFYRISPDTGKLVYAFEATEPAIKMGSGALDMLRIAAPFLRQPKA